MLAFDGRMCLIILMITIPITLGGMAFLLYHRRNPAVASRGLPLMLLSMFFGQAVMILVGAAIMASDSGNVSCHLVMWPQTLFIPLFFLVTRPVFFLSLLFVDGPASGS